MKEIDLSLYFEPCPFMEAANFYQDSTKRLGHQVEKYTVKERFPSLTALKNAVRSAQFVGVYAAFSILHPV